MKLSDSQYKILLDYVASKWQRPAMCSVCRSNNWSVSREVYELREFHGGAMVIGPSAIAPICPVTCGTCGNTILLNALVAGVDLKGDQLTPAK